ncbi:MAG TPA: CDP-alcohol phosphatidyltransferase [Blastocatellia bacterium]|nr:CDP-alcohol phosphatidyltransferase [Blastocatellia bacterium]HMX24555.1 CDP-alcohol phosphatidyltransferase [Blastocatellia bacterium]HMY74958.1 CDP-alcohol phosphatidyltransferase [Blastocatellia bacterium]HMZ23237.1 CDP-alcohol phosphatidyltransferase [Blastocatellia bacterium]HNG29669.1 CDP-alcohol phosphatidyltransferase [Blastocatellia bacterium]
MTKAKLLAWSVHFYTALGLVMAAGMAYFIVRGDAESFRWTIALMIAATFIDATDGTLARACRVKEILPAFDGRRLDDIIDFQTYTSLPLLFIWRTGVLPEPLSWWLLLPLLASAYGFSQAEAKTDDHFFTGFPSYWNVVALYLYWLQLPAWLSLTVVIVLSLLTLVPSLYLYTSYRGPFSRLTNWLLLGWMILLILLVAQVFAAPKFWMWVSLAFPIYYFVLSWMITLQRWFKRPFKAL